MNFPNPDLFYTLPNGQKELVHLSMQLVLEEAEKKDISWNIIPGTVIIEFRYQDMVRYVHDRTPEQTTQLAYKACLDKALTKVLLRRAGLQVVNDSVITKHLPQSEWTAAFETLKKPLVVKPTHASKGDAVAMGVHTPSDFMHAVDVAFKARDFVDAAVIVEEEFVGSEYRIMATPQKVVAVMKRIPANVVGNGTDTISQLINAKNTHHFRNMLDNRPYKLLDLDEAALEILAEQNYTPTSIPTAQQRVYLRRVSNLSQGGDGVDVTDTIDPSVAEICVRVIKAIPGLAFGGLDFMTTDITKPQTDTSYCIIEVNSNAEFDHHAFPIEGNPQPIAEEFLHILYPELI